MKTSKYNIIYRKKNKFILFNVLTGGMAYIDKEVANNLEPKLNVKKIDPSIVKMLKRQDYIIDDSVDEDLILELQYLQTQFDSSNLGLVIAPTMDCNFACPYCFENRDKHKMTKKIQDKIIQLVENKIKTGVKAINITWYGGEPLIHPDIIEYISSYIMEFGEKYKVKYGAYIITNGYLINKKIINMFIKNKIKGAQITIDGPPSIHNKRRILRNGKGTFEVLLKNIRLLLENNIDVSIRINVDKENIDGIEGLLKILKKEGLNQCHIALGHVRDYTPVCQSIKLKCLNKANFREIEYHFADLLNKYEFLEPYDKIEIRPKNVYCGAVMENYYVIDPIGYMYKCWNDVSVVEKAVGNVDGTEETYMLQNKAKYLTWNPFHFEKCKSCVEKPLCLGGCPFMSMKGELACEEYEKIFDKYCDIYANK